LVQDLFKGQTIHLDYIHNELKYSRTKAGIQLDVYIPSLNLAFEYQGEQHYSSHYLYGSPEIIQRRDQEKQMKCKEAGITLIHIPYWWDKEKLSLVGTVRQHRPELLQGEEEGTPIPLTKEEILSPIIGRIECKYLETENINIGARTLDVLLVDVNTIL
jgi:hypothetical protein